MAIKHIVMSIEWLENQLKNKTIDKKDLYCYRAFDLSYKEIKEALEDMKKRWRRFIPSEWCENVRIDWSCWC